MNRNENKLKARFGPVTRFDLTPAPPANFRATQETALETLKNRLLLETLNELAGPDANGFVRRAANEAAALAWDTRFPLLVFPALFEEKTEAALRQIRRQVNVRLRSPVVLAV